MSVSNNYIVLDKSLDIAYSIRVGLNALFNQKTLIGVTDMRYEIYSTVSKRFEYANSIAEVKSLAYGVNGLHIKDRVTGDSILSRDINFWLHKSENLKPEYHSYLRIARRIKKSGYWRVPTIFDVLIKEANS